MTSLKPGFLSDLKTHIAGFPANEFFFTIDAWIGFFFFSLLGKNYQILHIHEWKLWIHPKFVYRFSCTVVCQLDVSSKAKKIHHVET